MNGFLLGLATAAIVLVPMLQDRDAKIDNLLNDCGDLEEELRIRDSVERARVERLTFPGWN
jgi:hypothetical protein